MPSALFKLNSLTFCLALTTSLMVSPAYAIEIEQRSLSSNSEAVVMAKPQPTPTPEPAAKPQPLPAPAPSEPVAPAPAKTSTAAINPAWDMFQQVEELRSTIANLQGTVEEQQQIIERLQSDLRTRYTDLDQRLEQLTKPIVSPALVTDAPVVTSEAVVEPQDKPVEPSNPSVVSPTKSKPEFSAEEIERQKTAYLAAYQSFRREGAGPAITAMTGFLENYPDSVFAPNAHYWLGEFQLASEPVNYASAEASFQRVIRDYSASPKVASSFYKLGSIADLKGDKAGARNWMTKLLAQFPNSPEARLAKSFLDQNPAK